MALEAEDAASDAWTATCEAFDAARPVPPPAMRHRMAEHFEHQFPVLGETDTICDDERSDFYNYTEVKHLRGRPRMKRVGYIVEKATGARGDAFESTKFDDVAEEKQLSVVTDVEAQARASEIIAAWDRHSAYCLAVAQSLGCGDAETAYYAAVDARQSFGEQLSSRALRRSTASLCGLGSLPASSATIPATTPSAAASTAPCCEAGKHKILKRRFQLDNHYAPNNL